MTTRRECMYMYVPPAPYESRWLPDAGTREGGGTRDEGGFPRVSRVHVLADGLKVWSTSHLSN